MKKNIFLLFTFISISFACEKDDFCTQNPITPHLVIRFYDDANRTSTKSVERLSIIAENKTDSLYTNQSLDSIAIPLNSINNQTIYTLKINNTDGNIANNKIAKLTIAYTPENKYISRSCGFKVIFNTVSFNTTTNTWITDFTPSTLTTIDNQNEAHIKIFH